MFPKAPITWVLSNNMRIQGYENADSFARKGANMKFFGRKPFLLLKNSGHGVLRTWSLQPPSDKNIKFQLKKFVQWSSFRKNIHHCKLNR